MKNKILILLCLLWSSFGYSQIIQRASIGGITTSWNAEGISGAQIVGQPYQTKSLTTQNGKQDVLQGFIQPVELSILPEASQFKITISAYPNPTNGLIRFSTSEPLEDLNLQIFNQLGQVVYTEYISVLNNFVLDCSGFENGPYFAQFSDGKDNFYQSKLIVTK